MRRKGVTTMPLAVAAVLMLLQSLCWTSLAQAAPPASADGQRRELTPQERMDLRFPQPVRVGDLIGLPVLDDQDSTIGYVSDVVRVSTGKIQLVVPYAPWLGWLRLDSAAWGRRPIGVPIETVVILGRQIDALDMPRASFDTAPTFVSAEAKPIGREEIIRIALGRR